jgi:hypothetical protein
VTQVFDSSHCLLPLVKDTMFWNVDLLTSEDKTKPKQNNFYNVLHLVQSIEIVNLLETDFFLNVSTPCILRKWEGVVGTGWSWLRIGTGGERL